MRGEVGARAQKVKCENPTNTHAREMGAGDGDAARTGGATQQSSGGSHVGDAASSSSPPEEEEYGEAALASYLETHARELLSGRRHLSLSSRMLGRDVTREAHRSL